MTVIREGLSEAAQAAMADEESDDPLLALLTIEHEALEAPLRIVANMEDVFSRGHNFVALPFEIELPGDSPEGPNEARLRVDNVDRRIVEAIRTIPTPPRVTIEAIYASSPDDPEITYTDLTLRDASYDAASVSGALRFEDLTSEPIAERITPGRFPGLF